MPKVSGNYQDYGYRHGEQTHAHSYIAPHIVEIVERLRPNRLIDLGCGNGSLAAKFGVDREIVGVDASKSGIEIAARLHPSVRFEVGSVYDELHKDLGTFDLVVSTEVIEHLYDPRRFMKTARELLRNSGFIVLSTPYHGYLKNLALAASGKFDAHFTALWDGGHIKFWSIKTLSALLVESGFVVREVRRVGRVPPLAKSMIFVAQKK